MKSSVFGMVMVFLPAVAAVVGASLASVRYEAKINEIKELIEAERAQRDMREEELRAENEQLGSANSQLRADKENLLEQVRFCGNCEMFRHEIISLKSEKEGLQTLLDINEQLLGMEREHSNGLKNAALFLNQQLSESTVHRFQLQNENNEQSRRMFELTEECERLRNICSRKTCSGCFPKEHTCEGEASDVERDEEGDVKRCFAAECQ